MSMTREEKLQLNRDRRNVTYQKWAMERELVLKGKGTVDWTKEQQVELIDRGRVSGYEIQHMKSCSMYREHAGNINNTQILSHEDHLEAHKKAANSSLNKGQNHRSPYQNATNGWYNPQTGRMNSFRDKAPHSPAPFSLSNPVYSSQTDSNVNNALRSSSSKSISSSNKESGKISSKSSNITNNVNSGLRSSGSKAGISSNSGKSSGNNGIRVSSSNGVKTASSGSGAGLSQ